MGLFSFLKKKKESMTHHIFYGAIVTERGVMDGEISHEELKKILYPRMEYIFTSSDQIRCWFRDKILRDLDRSYNPVYVYSITIDVHDSAKAEILSRVINIGYPIIMDDPMMNNYTFRIDGRLNEDEIFRRIEPGIMGRVDLNVLLGIGYKSFQMNVLKPRYYERFTNLPNLNNQFLDKAVHDLGLEYVIELYDNIFKGRIDLDSKRFLECEEEFIKTLVSKLTRKK